MSKIKFFMGLIIAVMLFSCTEVGDSFFDKNSDSFNPILATDANNNGIADGWEDPNFNGILNKDDSAWLAAHPEIDSILNGKKDDDNIVDGPNNPDDTVDIDSIPIVDKPVEGKAYLATSGTYFKIKKGESFDPVKDAGVIVLDTNGDDASSDLEIDGSYDVDKVGIYEITFSYSGLSKKITLDVSEEGGGEVVNPIGNFNVSFSHDYKVGDSIVMPVNTELAMPVITATVASTNKAASVAFNSGVSTVSAGKEIKEVGRYILAWNLINPDDNSDYATYEVVVRVTGPSSISLDADYDFGKNNDKAAEVRAKLGDTEFSLPTADEVTATDGDGNALEVTVDLDGFDINKEGTYTVVYTASGPSATITRTIIVSVSDMTIIEITQQDKDFEILEAGSYSVVTNIDYGQTPPKTTGTLYISNINNSPVTATIDGNSQTDYSLRFESIPAQGEFTIEVDAPCKIKMGW